MRELLKRLSFRPMGGHLLRLHRERGEGTLEEFCAHFESQLSRPELEFLHKALLAQINIANFKILPTDRLTKELGFSDDLDYVVEPLCAEFNIRIPPAKQFFLEEDSVRALVAMLHAFKTGDDSSIKAR